MVLRWCGGAVVRWCGGAVISRWYGDFAQTSKRPRTPGGVESFMPAHSKTPYITPSMAISSGEGVVQRRNASVGSQGPPGRDFIQFEVKKPVWNERHVCSGYSPATDDACSRRLCHFKSAIACPHTLRGRTPLRKGRGNRSGGAACTLGGGNLLVAHVAALPVRPCDDPRPVGWIVHPPAHATELLGRGDVEALHPLAVEGAIGVVGDDGDSGARRDEVACSLAGCKVATPQAGPVDLIEVPAGAGTRGHGGRLNGRHEGARWQVER